MKSALPTTAQPAQKRRFSTDEEDSDDESAIVRPEDLVRRWGGVHVRGDSLEPVTARPLEVDQNARRRRQRCGFAVAVLCLAVVALAVAYPTVWHAARPLVRAAAYPVGAVCIAVVAAALLADVYARCCRRRRAAAEDDRAAPLMPNSAADTEFF